MYASICRFFKRLLQNLHLDPAKPLLTISSLDHVRVVRLITCMATTTALARPPICTFTASCADSFGCVLGADEEAAAACLGSRRLSNVCCATTVLLFIYCMVYLGLVVIIYCKGKVVQ
jgi:hypothetical protein